MWCKSVKGNSSPFFLFVKALALLLESSRWVSVHVLTVDQHEVDMMEAFTEMEVDGRLDNGAVEIPSDEEYKE